MAANKLLIPGIAGLAVVVGLAGGSLLSSTAANAATTSSTTDATATTAAATTDSSSSTSAPDQSQGGHTANGITETPLTGDTLAKATSAAEAAVSGGTVIRAETDAEGAAYEVHMKKSDGSTVTVKLDSSFNVTSTEDGMK
jgi:uncharacterized membrane protein YkoI